MKNVLYAWKIFTCITCKYNYTFNNNTKEKTCLTEHSELTTIAKQSLTTTITTILTTTQKIKTTIPTTTIKVPKINTTISNIPTTTIKTLKINNTIENIPSTTIKILKINTTIPNIPSTRIKTLNINTTIQNIPTTTINALKINTTIQNIPTTTIKISTTIPFIFTTIPKSIIHTTSLKANPKQECTVEAIVKGECKGKLTNEQIRKIYNQLKSNITVDANEIIETENVIFQILSLEEQKSNNNPNASSIDLGECE